MSWRIYIFFEGLLYCQATLILSLVQTPDNSLPFLIKDIAVLELAEEVDLAVYTPVCLPRAEITEEGFLID